MTSDRGILLEYLLPLLAETAIALAVLLVGIRALRAGHRWGGWAAVGGALWSLVLAVYLLDYVLVETGTDNLGYRLHEWNLVLPLRWLRLAGLALLVPALWLAHGATDATRAKVEHDQHAPR
ncbi:hypothetical protein [Nocardioides sp. SYSU DS0663]|uniref:hypothetical protein n=1 Tax=Nocardioides sp. SYSU DS0663 TaxID=3416445 RepID=UPI003F4BAEC5